MRMARQGSNFENFWSIMFDIWARLSGQMSSCWLGAHFQMYLSSVSTFFNLASNFFLQMYLSTFLNVFVNIFNEFVNHINVSLCQDSGMCLWKKRQMYLLNQVYLSIKLFFISFQLHIQCICQSVKPCSTYFSISTYQPRESYSTITRVFMSIESVKFSLALNKN